MVKLYESMATSFNKYLNEEVEEESIKECNDSFVESTNKVLNRMNESLQPDEDLDEYCDRLLDTLSEAIGYDMLCTEIIDYVSVQTLIEVLEHIADIYKVDVDSYIMNESLENGRTDSRESEVLDKVFAYLRDLKSDEEFAQFCLNKLDMTEEELKNFCGLNADGSEAIFESVDESLNESAWDELKSFLR